MSLTLSSDQVINKAFYGTNVVEAFSIIDRLEPLATYHTNPFIWNARFKSNFWTNPFKQIQNQTSSTASSLDYRETITTIALSNTPRHNYF